RGGWFRRVRRILMLLEIANVIFLNEIEGQGGYWWPGVFCVPPFVFQLAILATSSIPCSLGLPSSLVSPNSLACWRSQTITACLTDLPRLSCSSLETAFQASIAAASFGE